MVLSARSPLRMKPPSIRRRAVKISDTTKLASFQNDHMPVTGPILGRHNSGPAKFRCDTPLPNRSCRLPLASRPLQTKLFQSLTFRTRLDKTLTRSTWTAGQSVLSMLDEKLRGFSEARCEWSGGVSAELRQIRQGRSYRTAYQTNAKRSRKVCDDS